MYFTFDVAKSIEAIGVLYRTDRVDLMNSTRLMKLLYIADRKAFRDIGRPILGGPLFAMERGPVLKNVYELVREQHVELPLWSQYYRRTNTNLVQVKEPDVGILSEYEIETLQAVAKEHQDHDEVDLVEITHDFAEWKDNNPGKSDPKPISTKEVLNAVGRGEEADKIMAFANASTGFKRLVESHSK